MEKTNLYKELIKEHTERIDKRIKEAEDMIAQIDKTGRIYKIGIIIGIIGGILFYYLIKQ